MKSKDHSHESTSASAETTGREYIAEALEPRVLFSAAPVPADMVAEEVVDDSQVSAENGFDGTDEFAGNGVGAMALAAGEGDHPQGVIHLLNPDALNAMIAEAEIRWEESGLSDEQLAALDQITYEIVDLDGPALGYADGSQIFIDVDAAGYGWFVDATPSDDVEFSGATVGTVEGIDLLTVLSHELGHVFGLQDIYASAQQTDVMYGMIDEGERRYIDAGQAEGAEALSLEGENYIIVFNNGAGDLDFNDPANWDWGGVDSLPGELANNGTNYNAILQNGFTVSTSADYTTANGAPINFNWNLVPRGGDVVNINHDLETGVGGAQAGWISLATNSGARGTINQAAGTTVTTGHAILGLGEAYNGTTGPYANYTLNGTLVANRIDIERSGKLFVGATGYTDAPIFVNGQTSGAITATGSGGELAGLVTLDGSTVDFRGSGRTITFSGGISSVGNQSLSLNLPTVIETNPIDLNAGTLTITSAGNNIANATQINVGGNDWGVTRINFGGYLLMGGANYLPSDTNVQFGWHQISSSSGTLDLNGFDQTVASLGHSSHGIVGGNQNITGGGTLTVNQSINSTYYGRITDGATATSLVKQGTGTLILDNQSGTPTSYTGDTFVQAGTLSIANDDSLTDTSNVHLTTGGILDLTHAGTDQIASLTIDGVVQLPGTYGAIGSGATFETALITGSGILEVTTAAPVAIDDDAGATDEDTVLSVTNVASGVLANDAFAAGSTISVIASDTFSANGAVVSVNADGTYTYDPTASGMLQMLDVGESVVDTFTYTIAEQSSPTAATTNLQELSATSGANSFSATGLPGPVAATGSNVPSAIVQAYDITPPNGILQTNLDSISLNDMTLEMWIKPDVVNTAQVLFETGGSGTGSSIILNADGTVSWLVKSGANASMVTSTAPLVAGEWVQIAVTYDRDASGSDDVISLYLNGVLQQRNDQAATNSNGNTTITSLNDWSGTDNGGFGTFQGTVGGETSGFLSGADADALSAFDGQIGLVRLYEAQALSDAEVVANYDAANPAVDTATVTVTVTGVEDLPNAADDYFDAGFEDEVFTSGTANANGISTNNTVLDNDGIVAGAVQNFDVGNHIDAANVWVDTGSAGSAGNINLENVTLNTAPGSSHAGIQSSLTFGGAADPGFANFFNESPQSISSGIDTGDATFEVWIKPANLAQTAVIYETGGGTGTGIVMRGGFLEVNVSPGGTMGAPALRYDLNADTLGLLGAGATSEFFQVIWSLDNTNDTGELFINGTRIGAVDLPGLSDWDGGDDAGIGTFQGDNAGAFQNGASGGEFDSFYEGEMAAFRLYNQAFTEAEALQNYKAINGNTDVDGDSLTVVAVTTPTATAAGGTFTIDAAGVFTYDPNGQFDTLVAGESATDTFVYTITDDSGNTASATTTVVVHGKDDAVDDSVVVDEDKAFTINRNELLDNDNIGRFTDGAVLNYTPNLETNSTWQNGAIDGATFDADLGTATLIDESSGLSTGFTAIEQAYVLSGSGSGAEIGTITSAGGAGDISLGEVTFEIVFKPDASGTTPQVLFDAGGSGVGMSIIYDGAGNVNVVIDSDGVDESVSPGTGDLTRKLIATIGGVSTTEFNHLVVVFDKDSGTVNPLEDNLILYLSQETAFNATSVTGADGNGDPTETIADWSGTDSSGIGRSSSSMANGASPDRFIGQLALVRMYDRAFSAAEAEDAYDALKTTPTNKITAVSAISANGSSVALSADGTTVTYTPTAGLHDALAFGESATDTFTYSIDDGGDGTSTATVTVTIHGENDEVTAVDDSRVITESETGTNFGSATGVLTNDTDVDTSDTRIVVAVEDDTTAVGANQTSTGGSALGDVTYSVASGGAITVGVANSGDYAALGTGQSATETFVYTTADQNALTTGLEVHTAFGEVFTGTANVANDLSGNGRDGSFSGNATVVASASLADPSPLGGDVLSLDGAGDYVQLSGYTGVSDGTGMTPVTISAWIKVNPSHVNASDGGIVSWGPNIGGQKWVFRISGDNLRLETANGGVEGTAVINDGEWHHVVMVYDPSLPTANNHDSVRFYVDGEEDAISTSSSAAIDGPVADGDGVFIGTDRATVNNASRDFAGYIDDVGIWSRALTADDAAFIYNTACGQGHSFQEHDHATVTITIQGENDAPTAVKDDFDDTFGVTEDNPGGVVGQDVTDGSVGQDTDPDASDVADINAGTGDAGVVGHDNHSANGALVVVNQDGTIAAYQTTDPVVGFAFQQLQAGETITDDFSYTISDGSAVANGLFDVEVYNRVESYGGITDALAIWADVDAAGLTSATSGNVVNTGSTVAYEKGTNTIIDYRSGNGYNGVFTNDQAYDSIDPSANTITDDTYMSVRARSHLLFAEAGTYSIAVASDDGRQITLTDNTSGTVVATNQHNFDVGETIVTFTVTEGQILDLDTMFWQGVGNSAFEVLIKKGADTTFVEADAENDGWELLQNGNYNVFLSNDLTNLQDFAGAIDSAEVCIHIVGVNDAPDAVNDQNFVLEGMDSTAAALASGSVVANDTDIDDTDNTDPNGVHLVNSDVTVTQVVHSTGGTVAVAAANTVVNGQYGTLTISPDGSYSYDLDDSLAAVNALNFGDSLVETFTYTLDDNQTSHADGSDVSLTDTANLEIVILGTNDSPVAVADTNTAVEDGASVAGDIRVNDTDVDHTTPADLTITHVGTTAVAATNTNVSGSYGTLVISPDGSYTYTLADGTDGDGSNVIQQLAAGETLHDTFTYTVSDSGNQMDYDFGDPTNLYDWTILNGDVYFRNGNGDGVTPGDGAGGYGWDWDQTENLLISSPSFEFDGSVLNGSSHVLRVEFAGGEGNENNHAAPDTPAQVIAGTDGTGVQGSGDGTPNSQGQKGMAILNTASGQYEVVIYDPASGGAIAFEEYTLADLQALATAQGSTFSGTGTYQLHYFDNDEGGWGWGQLNQVQVAGVKTEKADIETLTITIAGTNDEPQAIADSSSVTETGGFTLGETATTGGNVLVNDVEIDIDANTPNDSITVIGVAAGTGSTPATGAGSSIVGTYGDLVINADGSYTYSLVDSRVDPLDTGDVVSEVFTYTIEDEQGATSTSTVTLTVNGTTDSVLTASPDTGEVYEDAVGGLETSGGTVAGTGPDVNVIAIDGSAVSASGSATITATYGSIEIASDGTWVYQLDSSLPQVQALNGSLLVTEVFSFTLQHSNGTTATSTITVDVNGENDAPEISDALPEIETGGANTPVTIVPEVTISDVDDTILSSATITIKNFVSGEDVLSVALGMPAGLNAVIDNATGVVTISGSASAQDYQAAIALVQYTNTSSNPTDVQRAACLVVSDGAESSNTLEIALNQGTSFTGIMGLFRELQNDTLFVGSTVVPLSEGFAPLESLTLTPFFAGLGTPGATVEIVVRDAVGNEIGRAKSIADQAGNWSTSLHADIARGAHYSVEVIQSPNYWGENIYSGIELEPIVVHFEGAQVAHPEHAGSLGLEDVIGSILKAKTVEEHIAELVL